MSHIITWKLFLEALRNPEDNVDLFKITSLVEPGKPFNAYSVMKGKNERTCINFHISQILNRLKTGRIPEPSPDYEQGADELYFYQYVLEWLEKTGSGSLSEDVLASNFRVEKINRKRNEETNEFEPEYTGEKITRSDANDLKRQELKSDPDAFRAKVPFSGNTTLSLKNPPKPKISDSEKWQKQRKPKSFKLSSQGLEKLFKFFDERYISFYQADKAYGDNEDQIAYWSAIYPELLDILKSGRWIWEISGQRQVITDKDNRDYGLGLRITPPEAARQLTELEFDNTRREMDRKNRWEEYGTSEFLQNIKTRSKKRVEGREVEILADGTIRVPVKGTSEENDRHRLFFTDDRGKLAKIFSIRKTNMRGGYFVSYIGRERQVFDSKSIQDILNFVDSDRKQITLPKIGFTIKKEPRFPYRTIPSDKGELRDTLFKYYDLWRKKEGLEPFERTTTIPTKDVETQDSTDVSVTSTTAQFGPDGTIYRKQR
jgi:hypothetical protein